MNRENCIEWLTGQSICTCSLTQKRYINRVRKLAEKYPELAEICHENPDGSIVAHISLKGLHLTIYGAKNTEEDTDEQSE